MPEFNFDYTEVMMMKMFLARPKDGGSEVLINFSDALRIIKKLDIITFGVPKIIYLVGWQNHGHDDRYPDIFTVNPYLKSDGDESAYDSLQFLIKEARKYHTTVSLHINFSDCYEDSEMFSEMNFIGALIRDESGKAVAVEEYNGKACYKVSYKEYWESGLFKKYFKRFLEFLPIIKEQKTIHVDNFQCYFNYNPDIHVTEMQKYRNLMIDYVGSCGLDITSEGVYRECEAGRDNYNCKVPKDIQLSTPIATLGKIPALWWLSPYGDNDYLTISPKALAGGIPGDEYFNVFYGSTHGENVWLENGCEDGKWESVFIDKFCRETIPYRYLVTKKCERIDTSDDGFKTAYFSDGTVSDGRTATVTHCGKVLKSGSDVAMPAFFKKNTYLFYSREASLLTAEVGSDFLEADLYLLSADGKKPMGKQAITNGKLSVKLSPKECVIAELK